MHRFKKFWKLGRPELNTGVFDLNRDGELVVAEGNYQYNLYDLTQRFGSPLEVAFPFMTTARTPCACAQG